MLNNLGVEWDHDQKWRVPKCKKNRILHGRFATIRHTRALVSAWRGSVKMDGLNDQPYLGLLGYKIRLPLKILFSLCFLDSPFKRIAIQFTLLFS
jgi:hypothetical protein